MSKTMFPSIFTIFCIVYVCSRIDILLKKKSDLEHKKVCV